MGIYIRASAKHPVGEPSCQVRFFSSADLDAIIGHGEPNGLDRYDPTRLGGVAHFVILYDGGNQDRLPRRLNQRAREVIKKAVSSALDQHPDGSSNVRWCWTGSQRLLLSQLNQRDIDPAVMRADLKCGCSISDIRRHKSFSEHYSLVAGEAALHTVIEQVRQDLTAAGLHFLEKTNVGLEDGERELLAAVERFVRGSDSFVPPQTPTGLQPEIADTEELLRIFDHSRNLILEGVPGTGKSHCISLLRDARYGDRVTTIVMHPSISYEDLIEGIRPRSPGTSGDDGADAPLYTDLADGEGAPIQGDAPTPFGIVRGQFMRACLNACSAWPQPCLLVLDEINRCNVPRALGDLLFLLEPSKRKRKEDGRWADGEDAVLPYSGVRFFVPDNLHVLGTMNTTDRSTAPLDSALRRRFAFHRLEPMPENILRVRMGRAELAPSIAAWASMNDVLKRALGPDLMLGHSYFFEAKDMLLDDRLPSEEVVRALWRYKLLPQLTDILNTSGRQDQIIAPLRVHMDPVLKPLQLAVYVEGAEAWRSAFIRFGPPPQQAVAEGRAADA